MASSTTHHRRGVLGRQMAVVLLLLASTVAMPAAASGAACESEKFAAGTSYATCSDLPTLGAALHWTYDAAASSLSLAFVVPTPVGGAGWVSWGINPTGDGMKGAQSLLAFQGASGAYVVNTYNLTGYRALGAASTPIAFEPTGLAADEGAGKVRLYGKLQLPKGMVAVNHIWQVGSTVASGAPVKHAFAKENLEAEGRLVLAGGGGGASEPAPAPEAGESSAIEDGELEEQTTSSPAPATGAQKAATGASTYASAPVLMVLACVGFLVTMISQ